MPPVGSIVRRVVAKAKGDALRGPGPARRRSKPKKMNAGSIARECRRYDRKRLRPETSAAANDDRRMRARSAFSRREFRVAISAWLNNPSPTKHRTSQGSRRRATPRRRRDGLVNIPVWERLASATSCVLNAVGYIHSFCVFFEMRAPHHASPTNDHLHKKDMVRNSRETTILKKISESEAVLRTAGTPNRRTADKARRQVVRPPPAGAFRRQGCVVAASF